MQKDFDSLDEVFGNKARELSETGRRPAAGRPADDAKNDGQPEQGDKKQPPKKAPTLKKLDDKLYDPDKHAQREREQDEELRAKAEADERDYRPIRGRRDGKIGCLGGLMYFVFVISLSIILACLAWLAATDVLALNKLEQTAEITLPQEAFSEKTVRVENEDGSTEEKTVQAADIGYVAQALKDAGIIQYKTLFRIYCDISNAEEKIDPGTYELNTIFDYRALVKKMQSGSGAMVATTLTFPEGFTMEQIFSRLEENGICSKADLYEAAANYSYNYSFLADLGVGDAKRLEGYLFPDTYDFYEGMQASSAVNKFLENFYYKITAEMYTWANNLGISLHQAVIVASMVESEAANDDERALIASVIYNRLKNGMKLQIDATVMYALGEHKEKLTAEDLAVQNPYNTYYVDGLPAGPISNPGSASLTAALRPADTEYLYYALDVATGVHQFFTNKADFDAFVATQSY